jgi:hypothetical protein
MSNAYSVATQLIAPHHHGWLVVWSPVCVQTIRPRSRPTASSRHMAPKELGPSHCSRRGLTIRQSTGTVCFNQFHNSRIDQLHHVSPAVILLGFTMRNELTAVWKSVPLSLTLPQGSCRDRKLHTINSRTGMERTTDRIAQIVYPFRIETTSCTRFE